MKTILILSVIATVLSGCSHMSQQKTEKTSVSGGNPVNPSCLEQGGQLDLKNQAQGQSADCHLSDGRIVEEQSMRCISEQAMSLIGQIQLSETQIKQQTGALQVRIVNLGQPVTMDYWEDRVTVTLDPKTHQILQASCG